MDISAIALQGVQQAEVQLEQAATAIASAGGGGADTVDISAQMVAMMSAQNQTALNLDVLKTANEVQQSMLNIMA
jgi:hypothetical protein